MSGASSVNEYKWYWETLTVEVNYSNMEYLIKNSAE